MARPDPIDWEIAMNIANEAWVIVLDGEKFLMLKNHGDDEIIDLRVIDHDEIEALPTRDQGTDRPGRMPDPGVGKSAVQQTDWHALEKQRFAADIADRLRHWALENRFHQLVVCADPRTLGTIRQKYHAEVSRRIVAEIDKDLTALPVDEIERVLLAA
jgi:protein required for attachment to host cells